MKVTFNGSNKTITVNPDITNINVRDDLYSTWKRWLAIDSNMQYLQAFRTFGGDPTNTDGSQIAPQYFFLMNGWRVVVDGISVTFALNLYTDEGDSPFIVINNGAVNAQNSDAPVVVVNGGGTVDTNVWEQLILEHHEPGSFGDLMQKLYLDAHKTSLNRFE